MILDSECSHLYFADTLQQDFPNDWQAILEALKPFPYIQIRTIEGTKDIWARDYMPLQVSHDKFEAFRYYPSYLLGDPALRTNIRNLQLCEQLLIRYSGIILDAGNVLKGKEKAIITDRVYTENSQIDQRKLIQRLEKRLNVELIVMPAYSTKDDMTGHIDGMMRFVNEDVVVGNDLSKDRSAFRNKILQTLKDHRIEYIPMPYFEDPVHKMIKNPEDRISARGIYVNFLEISNVILFPIFEIHGKESQDTKAFQQIESLFPDRNVIPININSIAMKGGLMNCISWCKME